MHFVIANSADADEMPCFAFHLGLHCLQKYALGSFKFTKGLSCIIFVKVQINSFFTIKLCIYLSISFNICFGCSKLMTVFSAPTTYVLGENKNIFD